MAQPTAPFVERGVPRPENLKCEKCHEAICVSNGVVKCETCGHVHLDHPFLAGAEAAKKVPPPAPVLKSTDFVNHARPEIERIAALEATVKALLARVTVLEQARLHETTLAQAQRTPVPAPAAKHEPAKSVAPVAGQQQSRK